MIPEFYNGTYAVDAAAPLVLGSGGTKSVSIALDDDLLATTKPTIKGTAAPGKKLTASTGAWNVEDDLSFHFQWKSGSKNVGTDSPSYKVGKKDKKVTVTVTAVDDDGEFTDGTSTSKAVKVKVKKPKKGKKGKR